MDRTFTGYNEDQARKQYLIAAEQLAEQGWYPVGESVTKEVRRLARDLVHVAVTFERGARRPAVASRGEGTQRSARPFVPPADRPYASTTCPSCGQTFDPLPKRKTTCSGCNTTVFIRSGPDGMRYILDEPGMLAMQAAWDAQAVNRWESGEPANLGNRPSTPRIVNFEIVGESHYQDVLLRTVGGRRSEPVDFPVVLDLVCEPDNPYDKRAVRVVLNGATVGYLSKTGARAYEPIAAALSGQSLRCNGRIVGGWSRGFDFASFGVLADLPSSAELLDVVTAGKRDLRQ